MPSSQHLLLKQFLTAATGPLARQRPSLGKLRLACELGALFQFLPWNVFLEETSIEGMEAEWLRPQGAPAHRVLLYLHGGGYVLGSPNTHRSLIGALAQRCQMPALSINYRKAPEYPFPAALQDALLAYRWLLQEGFQPYNIMVAGDSAGGGLALALLLALRDGGEALPAAAIGLSPWMDLALPAGTLHRLAKEETQVLEALEIRNWGAMYAAGTAPENPLLSPSKAALHNLPPLLIQLSDAEVLCEDGLCFVQKAQVAGVAVTLQQFEGLVHWWHLFWRFLPEGRQALDQVAEFVQGIWEAQAEAKRLVAAARKKVKIPAATSAARLRKWA